MSRDDGFEIADVDTGLLGDPKVRRLVRRAKDRADAATTLLLYVSLLLESWGHGDRVHFDDGAPLWWIGEDDADRLRALQEAGLLDGDGMIPENAWERWFGPARDRREQRRLAGAEGGRRSGAQRRSSVAEPTPKRRLGAAEAAPNPSVPSVLSDRAPRARSRETSGGARGSKSLGDIIGEMEL